MILLSILIPSTFDREEMLFNLLKNLYEQIITEGASRHVEIISDVDDGTLSIGAKRNLLLERASGNFVVYIDSDDEVSNDYLHEVLKAIEQNPDVVSFNGYMSTDGKNKEQFKINKDLLYTTIWDAHGHKTYLRFNNHLSPVKREIALQIKFPDIRFAEDYDYAVRLKNSGLVKTQVYIEKELYHYKYVTNKKQYK
jgi:glycosyltransferase involved in cell wall biosynthesis